MPMVMMILRTEQPKFLQGPLMLRLEFLLIPPRGTEIAECIRDI